MEKIGRIVGLVLDAAAGGRWSREDGRVVVRTTDAVRALHALTGEAMNGDLTLDGLEVVRPTLEDVYLELTAEDDR